jgi:uncharacterized membrane protein (UPF0127 family)
MLTVYGPGSRQLFCNGQPVAPLVIAETSGERRRGLLGSDRLEGAVWLQPCSSVHCVGMRYAIDVALLDRRGRVLRIVTLRPGRMTLPSLRVRIVVEAPAGSFTEWGIHPGDVLSTDPS